MKRFLPYLAAITMSVIFGFSFMFTKNALTSLDTFQLLFLRFLTAFVTMSLFVIIRVVKVNYRGKSLKPLLLVALFQPALYFIMETYGLKYTTSSEAGVMIAFIPALVAVLSIFILNESINKLQGASVILSVAGVIAIVLADGGLKTGGQMRGILFLIGAVVSGSIYSIVSKKALVKFTPYETTYFMMGFGMLFFGAIALTQGFYNGNIKTLFEVNSSAFISIMYLGVLSSVGAYFLINYSLSKLTASQSTVFSNLTTVVSVAAGIVFRNESFGTVKIIGAALIILGVFGTNYFVSQKPAGADVIDFTHLCN